MVIQHSSVRKFLHWYLITIILFNAKVDGIFSLSYDTAVDPGFFKVVQQGSIDKWSRESREKLYICDLTLEKCSKSHIRNFEINSFIKYFKSAFSNLQRIASISMKCTQEIHQSITIQATSSTCSCL